MRKAIAILPVVSAIYPMITGATAPPTIVMMSNEEASLVFVPASLNASKKIVGNMMLSPRYRAKNAMSDKVPLHTTTLHPCLLGSIGIITRWSSRNRRVISSCVHSIFSGQKLLS